MSVSPISFMVFDCFCLFNELDLLELRLNILDKDVDYFVLAEAEETFSGKPKLLYYEENKDRFVKWNHKIVHLINNNLETEDAFKRAAYQKDCLREVLKLTSITDEDTVYFGDIDEIWKPQRSNNRVCSLQQLNYSYYLNNLSSEEWIGTIVGKWGLIKTNTMNYWRALHQNVLFNAGWHFSNLGGVEQIKKKIEAYDHQEYNKDSVKDNLEYKMKNNLDYLGRLKDYWGNPFEFKIDEDKWPQFLKDHKQEYQYLCK